MPQTRYAKSGDVNIAYQVIGEGPFDLVFIPGFVSQVELAWEYPEFARLMNGLASFSRLIVFDKRGTGLSDRVPPNELPTLEVRMDDIRAVMDAAGSEKAALLGVSEGGPLSILFAATHPDRTRALVLFGSYAKMTNSEDYSVGVPAWAIDGFGQYIRDHWGEPRGFEVFLPSMGSHDEFRDWWGRLLRSGASPAAAEAVMRMAREIDVRAVLPTLSVPALVLGRTGDRFVPAAQGRYLAEHILGARYVELPGDDHLPFVDPDPVIAEVQEFLTGDRPEPDVDRVLATVLFTDIVGSTEKAAEIGDREWKELLVRFYSIGERQVERFRGRQVKTTGDGVLATFDGPARAVRCAQAIREGASSMGLQVRSGLHTGECEVIGDDVGGIAVHIAARVAADVGAGEVYVSSTVKDLVAGSGLEFDDLGMRPLKGVPDEWRLFAVRG